jgi:hypothetical protein
LDSGFKYLDGNPINNGDMFEFKDGNLGFIFYDAQTGIWNVKFRSKANQAFIEPLESIHRFIARFVI